MFEVSFIEVGPDKKSWRELMPKVTPESLEKSVRRHAAPLSREIDCVDGAVVVGGWRVVGHYLVRDATTDQSLAV